MFPSHLDRKLKYYHDKKLMRERKIIHERLEDNICVNGKYLINFTSNDYLCISTHPQIKRAWIHAIQHYGFGSGGSALVSGYTQSHALLEQKMAAYYHYEDAILFPSGYHANLGIITTLADRKSVIYADRLCHASITDAILLSRAKHIRYSIHDLDFLKLMLTKQIAITKLMVIESVSSMRGEIHPIKTIALLAKQHQCFLAVDEAHSMGVLGPQGKGICDYFSLTSHDIPLLIIPLGKTFGGTGAIVLSNRSIINCLKQFAKTYMYSTSLPPATAHVILQSLNYLSKAKSNRKRLNELIHFFNQEALKRGLPLASLDLTPIRVIRVFSAQSIIYIQKYLMYKGFFVAAIRAPTVPKGTAILRISLNCKHTPKQIQSLLDHVEIALNHEHKIQSL